MYKRLTIGILVILNLGILLLLLSNKNRNTPVIALEFQSYIDENQNRFALQNSFNNEHLSDSLLLLSIDEDTVYACDVFAKNSLVLRYSFMNCNSCIEFEQEMLKKYASDINSIYILATYENYRNLYLDIHEFQSSELNVEFYLIPIESKPLNQIEDISIPYYFCIDQKLKVTNTFIPTKTEPELTNIYLSSLKSYY